MMQPDDIIPFLDQILKGDCLELLPLLPDNSVNLILCDLPYGTTINPWDTLIDFNALWLQYKRILKSAGVVILTGAGRFTAAVINSNPDWFKYKIVWIQVHQFPEFKETAPAAA